MPTLKLVTIAAWSHSRLSCYTQCPRKARYQYIDKLKEPDGEAGKKGTRVHAIAATYATGVAPRLDKDNADFHDELAPVAKAKVCPPELETFKEEFAALKKRKGVMTEKEWAFTKDWQPCSWFASNCWLRIKVDLVYLDVVKNGKLRQTRVIIRDHKTGKIYEDHGLQRSLYALGAFLMYPDAVEVEAAHWYLELGEERVERWRREQLEALKAEWIRRTTAMLSDTTFAPRPSDKCRWCWFRKDNKGPCEF